MKTKATKAQVKKRTDASREAKPKLAVKLTDKLEIWSDPRNYILKNNEGKILGYYSDLVPMIWKIFKMDVKLSLQQEKELKDIVEVIEKAERYIRSLSKKLEDLQQLG